MEHNFANDWLDGQKCGAQIHGGDKSMSRRLYGLCNFMTRMWEGMELCWVEAWQYVTVIHPS